MFTVVEHFQQEGLTHEIVNCDGHFNTRNEAEKKVNELKILARSVEVEENLTFEIIESSYDCELCGYEMGYSN